MENIYHQGGNWNKEKFLAELSKGHKQEEIVRDKFVAEGFDVILPDSRKAKDNFIDTGDLFINIGTKQLVFEIKSSQIEFNCIEDYPYDDVMFEMVENWQKKEHKDSITAYITISQKTGFAFVVPCSLKDKWYIQTKRDSKRNYTKKFWFIKKRYLATFDDLVEFLKQKEIKWLKEKQHNL